MHRILGGLLVAAAALAPLAAAAQDDERTAALQRSYSAEGQGAYASAIQALLPLFDDNPRDYFLNLRLGWLHYLNGAYANSVTCYETASKAAPKAVEPRVGMLLPLLAQRKYVETEVAAKQILTLDPGNFLASLRMSYALRLQRKYDQAEIINRKFLQLYPTDISFLLEQGLTHLGQGKKEEAARQFQLVLLVDPANATAKQSLAAAGPAPRAAR